MVGTGGVDFGQGRDSLVAPSRSLSSCWRRRLLFCSVVRSGAVRNATWNWRWYIRPKVGACTSGLLVHGK